MLTRYFGFQEEPFGATPDPRFLYSSRTHREALASLQYAFRSNRGITALIAPPGMGKTTLLFEFLQQVRDTARTAFLFNSLSDPADLLRSISAEIDLPPQDSIWSMLQQLNSELLITARSGRRFVVIVDEAQNLSEEALETLRMLTNFETARAKLMQIVLSGQPQLGVMLLQPNLVQLRQRISTLCRLEPFSREETEAYIGHRLAVAGYTGSSLFTSAALALIDVESEGIPRNINTLCFNALSLSHALRKTKVDSAIVEEVLQDLRLASTPVVEHQEQLQPIQVAPRITTEPETHSRLFPARFVTLALILLVAICGAYWAFNVFIEGPRRAQRSTLPQDRPVSDKSFTAVPSADGATAEEALEITVEPKQTLSEISVQTLGSFDDQLLAQIKRLNPRLADPDQIHPGEKLLLPRKRQPNPTTEER